MRTHLVTALIAEALQARAIDNLANLTAQTPDELTKHLDAGHAYVIDGKHPFGRWIATEDAATPT